jgi:rhodanese-related sulfurtransferase
MRRLRFVYVWLLLAALFFVGCQGNANQVGATPGITATAISTNADDYWGLVKQAQSAYAIGDYKTALEDARRAISLSPEENTAWELYSQAAVAQAGDDYLSQLPDYRYQLPVSVFVRDRVNQSRDWFIVDVREPDEFTAGHIDGAINLPLRQILENLDKLPNSKSAPILLYCHSQKRATHALVVLHELGYLKVFNLEGGYAAYEDWMNSNPLPTPGPTPTPGPDEPDLGC